MINWEAKGNGVYDKKEGGIVAEVFGFKKVENRARLIAAAPNLLDALQDLFDDWVTLTEQDYNGGDADVKRIQSKVERALRKAKGGV